MCIYIKCLLKVKAFHSLSTIPFIIYLVITTVKFFRYYLLIPLVFTFATFNILLAGSDEGELLKSRVYNQADAAEAVLDSAPYHFIVSARNSFQEHFASVLIPTNGSWNSNPLILVAPSLLVGSHYIFDQGFSDQSSMDSAFPEGSYTFNISRNYDSSTTEFQQSLILAGSSLPSEYPEISNSEWEDGHLVLHPAEAVINYSSAQDLGFQWELVGGGGSAGGSSSGAGGALDLISFLKFGQSYDGYLRFVSKDSESTYEDNNLDENSSQRLSTYAAYQATEVRFSIKMVSAAAEFEILEARFIGGDQEWNAKELLVEKVQNDSLIYRVDRGELSSYSYYDRYGDLYLKYKNGDGTFETLITYDFDEWDNYLILPDSSHQILPISFTDWATNYFDTTQLTDLSIWGLSEDPDGDLITNICEFAYGTNPTIADNNTNIIPNSVTYEDVLGYKYFGVSYRRNKSAQLNFSVQHSFNLDSWSPVFPSEIVEDIPGELALEQVSVFSSISMHVLDEQFLRLVISDPNQTPIAFPVADLQILEATYGADGSYNNVKEIIEGAVIDNAVSISADNSYMGGDPISGTPKQLFVRYIYQGIEYAKTTQEGQTLILP